MSMSIHQFLPASTDPNLNPPLSEGRLLVNAASAVAGWLAVPIGEDASNTSSDSSIYATHATRALVFCSEPPSISPGLYTSKLDTKEWGVPVSKDELYDASELPDFQNTLLGGRTSSERPLTPAGGLVFVEPASRRKTSPSPSISPRSSKRRRLSLDADYLRNAIPKPHFHRSPLNADPPSPSTCPIAPFTKRSPTPLSSDPQHTLDKLLSSDPWSRGAWIIPVSGSFPDAWSLCTPAVFLTTPDSSGEGGVIWDRDSLSAFWKFLLALIPSQKLGSLSVAYALPSPTSSPRRPTQLDLAHIKVYTDLRFALHLRSALDAWSYAPAQDSKTKTEGGTRIKSRPIRILKGAALPLVDEVGCGLLAL